VSALEDLPCLNSYTKKSEKMGACPHVPCWRAAQKALFSGSTTVGCSVRWSKRGRGCFSRGQCCIQRQEANDLAFASYGSLSLIQIETKQMRVPEHPAATMSRRRTLYALKIDQEERALSTGITGPGSPADYRSIQGKTREERLSAWKLAISEMDRELALFNEKSSVQ
jgi:hypothetical protein